METKIKALIFPNRAAVIEDLKARIALAPKGAPKLLVLEAALEDMETQLDLTTVVLNGVLALCAQRA
jgi:hypothetical protein